MNKLDFFNISSVEEVVEKYKDLRHNNPISWSPEYDAWIITKYDDIISILNNEEIFSRALGDNYLVMDKFDKQYIEDNFEAIVANNNNILKFNVIIHNYYKQIYSNFNKNDLFKIFNSTFSNIDGEVNFKKDWFNKIIIDVYLNFFNLDKDIIKEFNSQNSIEKYVINNLKKFDIYKYMEENIDNNDLATKNEFIAHLTGFMTTILYDTYETMIGCYSIILNNIYKYNVKHDEISLFIKESLRLASFNMSIGRKVIKNYSMNNIEFKTGDTVILLLGSANYDESYFGQDSNVFNLNRQSRRTAIEFGYGLRFCIAKKFIVEQLSEFTKFILDNKNKISNLTTTYDSRYTDISSPIKDIYGTVVW